MKRKLLFIVITAVTLLFFPGVNFGQAPVLGAASSFAIFTSVGAFNLSGLSDISYVTGDVGTNYGAFYGFPPGTLIGQKHVVDAVSAQAATDLATAYGYLSTLGGSVLGVTLGGGQTLTPGVYNTGAAATLNGDLTLNGDGIFIIRIGGALSVGATSAANVILTGSASLCNVYWQINGQFDLAGGSVFRGTAIVNGAINLLGSSSLFGRGLSKAGAISLFNNTVTNPTGTWLGTTNTNWNTASNWCEGVPVASTDVSIPDVTNDPLIGAGTPADCHNLTIASGATLTINSDALANNGSLIVHGTFTGPGTVIYNRYMSDRWHLVSSPVSGQSATTGWMSSNSISSPGTNQYEFINYLESSDTWDYLEAHLPSSFATGKGYGLLRNAAGTVAFTGTINTTDVSPTLARTINGWNLIGNPFTSAININTTANATNNFLTVNSGSLDPSFAVIYLWEEGANYDGVTNYFTLMDNGGGTAKYIQAGQGFMVKSKAGGGSVSFTEAMQSHMPSAPMKSANMENWYGLQLKATAARGAANTRVWFNDNMNKGLDVTYDAGLLRSGGDIEIFTRLVNDNGIDFAVQALPASGMDKVAIPVGIEYAKGGEVAFSANVNALLNGEPFMLEDRVAAKFTNLNSDTYTVTLPANTKGTGRFFIYAGQTTGLTKIDNPSPVVVVWYSNAMINIQGKLSGNATARLFDLSGKLLREVRLPGTQLNRLSAPASAKGMYLLQIIDGNRQTTKKVTVTL